MEIAVADAGADVAQLVRRVVDGEEIVLTRDGQPTVRLVAIASGAEQARRRKVIEEIQERARRGDPGAMCGSKPGLSL